MYLSQPAGKVYLSNQLLSNDHAVIKCEWERFDWGDK